MSMSDLRRSKSSRNKGSRKQSRGQSGRGQGGRNKRRGGRPSGGGWLVVGVAVVALLLAGVGAFAAFDQIANRPPPATATPFNIMTLNAARIAQNPPGSLPTNTPLPVLPTLTPDFISQTQVAGTRVAMAIAQPTRMATTAAGMVALPEPCLPLPAQPLSVRDQQIVDVANTNLSTLDGLRFAFNATATITQGDITQRISITGDGATATAGTLRDSTALEANVTMTSNLPEFAGASATINMKIVTTDIFTRFVINSPTENVDTGWLQAPFNLSESMEFFPAFVSIDPASEADPADLLPPGFESIDQFNDVIALVDDLSLHNFTQAQRLTDLDDGNTAHFRGNIDLCGWLGSDAFADMMMISADVSDMEVPDDLGVTEMQETMRLIIPFLFPEFNFVVEQYVDLRNSVTTRYVLDFDATASTEARIGLGADIAPTEPPLEIDLDFIINLNTTGGRVTITPPESYIPLSESGLIPPIPPGM